jgi:AraC-like DNA-binding protein
VLDYCCEARRGDRAFAEEHASMSASYVSSGTFGYRSRGKSFELVAGSVLIGHAGDEFACTHDYAGGDRCLSIHFSNDLAQEIGGAHLWRSGCIPPLERVAAFGELAQAAAAGRTAVSVEEAALFFADCVSALVSKAPPATVRSRDRKRAVETAAWLDEHAAEPVDLQTAAAVAGLSPYHFLRVFSLVVGITPHQYVMRARLRRAARLLASSDLAITSVAYESGFTDVSNFARSFRRAAGKSPRDFRNFCQDRRPALR